MALNYRDVLKEKKQKKTKTLMLTKRCLLNLDTKISATYLAALFAISKLSGVAFVSIKEWIFELNSP